MKLFFTVCLFFEYVCVCLVQALNQLFEKIMALDIDERHLLRMGHGEEELETEKDFSRCSFFSLSLSLSLSHTHLTAAHKLHGPNQF